MKNKITTIGIIIATLVLAGIAIFTAYRLYQLRQQAVAPTAPESKPAAGAPSSCSGLAFNLSIPPTIIPLSCNTPCNLSDDPRECGQGLSCLNTSSDPNSLILKCRNPQCPSQANCICAPGIKCSGKLAYKDSSSNIAGTYHLDTAITAGSDIDRGQTFVYAIKYSNTGTAAASGVTISDVLDSRLTFKDSDSGCTYTASTKTVTCNLGNVVAGGALQKAIRVTVSGSATAGALVNKATVKDSGTASSDCQISLNITGTHTGTPTPPASCNTSCSSNANCQSDLVCVSNLCRHPDCTSDSDCVCTKYCNQNCGNNSDCTSGLSCISGLCRNASCSSETDCTCATTTATATGTATASPTLPEAGVGTPTIFGIGLGAILIILSLALAL